MGLTGASWSSFGANISNKNPPAVPTEGKVVAVELYGLLVAELKQMGRDHGTAKAVAEHVAGKPQADASLTYRVAHAAVQAIHELCSVSRHVYVVGEGEYTMKRHEKARRTLDARARHGLLALAERHGLKKVARSSWKITDRPSRPEPGRYCAVDPQI